MREAVMNDGSNIGQREQLIAIAKASGLEVHDIFYAAPYVYGLKQNSSKKTLFISNRTALSLFVL